MQKRKYQALTEDIARSGGLQTDLRTSYDPIYENERIGQFLRNTVKTRHPFATLIISLFFYCLSFVFGMLPKTLPAAESGSAGKLFTLFLLTICFSVATKLLWGSIKDFLRK